MGDEQYGLDILAELLEEMNQNNMILYVGKKTDSAELSEVLCSLRWRCVVTSQTKEDFGTEFKKPRYSKRYTKFEDLPQNLFDSESLPIIQIYGADNILDEGIDDIDDPYMEKLLRKKDAEKIMNRIMNRMDVRCKMVVIGYDPEDPGELPVDTFMTLWYEMQGGQILFFGIPKEETKKNLTGRLYLNAKRRRYTWSEQSLSSLLEEAQDELDNYVSEDDQSPLNRNLFYKGKQPVLINTNILLRCRNFAQLLTEESIYQNRPHGKLQQSIWYYNYLKDSALGPCWYGYLPQSDYHVKRDFEDTLVDLVHNIISGRELYNPGMTRPIILEGDPGSSKSITLGALAYRIFSERINPVVFIKNDDLLFNSENSQEFKQLEELLQEIDNTGNKDVRTLILWDSASYRNVSELAGYLARKLENVGRRFVLVCTAYKGSRSIKHQNVDGYKFKGNTCFYVHEADGKFVRKENRTSDQDEEVFFDGKNFFVKSERKMSESEKKQLRSKINQYMDIDIEQLNRVWKRLEKEGDNDIFDYFYILVDLIRPNLEDQLSLEQRVVGSYVNKQLVLLGAKEQTDDDAGNIMLQALLDAGVPLSTEDVETLQNVEEELNYYDLDRFNICVAMFSRFKLDTPYYLGIHMLYINDSGKSDIFYNNMELFRLITNDIPWIYYGENAYGNFIFRFRNSLEAELFLEKNGVGADSQIEMICDMLDYYGDLYAKTQCEDDILMHAIQRLLRMIGPNTDYRPFCQGGAREHEHKKLLQQLEKIISKLSYLRKELQIPDVDASLANIEVTFIREYYGKLWERLNAVKTESRQDDNQREMHPELYTEEKYRLRLEKMKDASDLALENVYRLELERRYSDNSNKRHITSRINSLSVEISYCNTSLERLLDEYDEYCWDKGDKRDEILNIEPLPYHHPFQLVMSAITSDSTNGYAYNALFNLFEREYEKNQNDEDKQLELLSEVRMVADDAASMEITNRGMEDRDELSDHIQNIQQYSDKFKVTIDSILDDSCSKALRRLFDRMLENNKASGITFVCQQEMDMADLGNNVWQLRQEQNEKEVILNDKQIEVCGKILNFMDREEYLPCVEQDSYALYLKLRVAWMFYNKRPINSEREAQLTYISAAGWQRIHSICEKYNDCCGQNKKPIVMLILALSTLQISQDYIKTNRIMDSLNEDMFDYMKRMRVPYLYCNEVGEPYIYSGTVKSVKYNSGFMYVNKMPAQLGTKNGVRFNSRNLGVKNKPLEKGDIKSDLELGLGYTGFSLYTREGRIKSQEVQ